MVGNSGEWNPDRQPLDGWSLTYGRQIMKPVEQTPLASVRGLGSARTGSRHWWLQRVSALTLAPLTIWFVVSFTVLIHNNYQAYSQWIASPLNAVLTITLVSILFYHMSLGLQVIVEDYLHTNRIKFLSIATVQFTCFIFAIAGIVSVLQMMT